MNGVMNVAEHQQGEAVQNLWSLLQQSYLLASRYFELVSARFGLSYPQATALNVLHTHGESLPLSRVARFMTQEAQSMTELADRLERRGYVRRTRDARDRRLVLLELTDAGREVIEAIQPALNEAGEQIFGNLNQRQVEQFSNLLADIRTKAADLVKTDRPRLLVADEAAGRR